VKVKIHVWKQSNEPDVRGGAKGVPYSTKDDPACMLKHLTLRLDRMQEEIVDLCCRGNV